MPLHVLLDYKLITIRFKLITKGELHKLHLKYLKYINTK